ncbi:MAG: flagellar biosynthesis anti-sigma factor FlgM [Schwartzia sp.]|nr:flagellar biosynthesis anti-sigma factor FlgM [Schwartzia sp. (in: firmicutes)]
MEQGRARQRTVNQMIISSHIQAAAGLYAGQQQSAPVRNVKRAEAPKATDFVMSSEAKSFSQTLLQLRGEADDARMDRVEALREQFAKGTYHVDAQTLAADMLAMRY